MVCFAPAVSRQQLMGNDQFSKGDRTAGTGGILSELVRQKF